MHLYLQVTYLLLGTPDLLLTLTAIIEPSFHPCVGFVPAWATIYHVLTELPLADSTVSPNQTWCHSSRPMAAFNYADGISVRPRKQARRSASAHRRCSGTTPNASTIHVARHAFRDRSRLSLPSHLYTPIYTLQPTRPKNKLTFFQARFKWRSPRVPLH